MRNSILSNLIGILTVIALIEVYTSENKIVKLACGVSVIILLIISLIQSQRSIDISDNQKRLSWIILIPLFSLMLYLYTLIK
jgi:uncharacterized transporter YbjL